MSAVSACPDPERLRRLVERSGTPEEIESLARHLEQCEACGTAVEVLLADSPTVAVLRSSTGTDRPRGQVLQGLLERLRRLRPVASPGGSAVPRKPASADLPSAVTELGNEAPPAPPQSGDPSQLGHYRILERLGQGGMGLVFLAEDTLLRRKVALKTLLPALAANPQARERFLREARAAAAIEHENIITIYQVGEDQAIPYLAMPLLKGESLSDRLERDGPLPTSEALRIAEGMAEGLAAAHTQGLIHRDIKPGNVWLEAAASTEAAAEPGGQAASGEYRVKLLDFGLARSQADDVRLTQAGTVVGTPAFMAPEQVTGQGLDGRADLFSLGCVLYLMLTGQRPFKGNDTISVLAAVALDTPVPPQEVNPSVPERLSRLTLQLLAKDPSGRPASAGEVARQLRKLRRAEEEQTVATLPALARPAAAAPRGTPGRWTLFVQLIAAAVFLLALLPAGYFCGRMLIRPSGNKSEPVVEVANPSVESEPAPPTRSAALPDKEKPFVLLRGGKMHREYKSFAGALAELADGDVVEVHGNGPFELSRIELRGKSLTLKAAPGYRPRFRPHLSVYDSDPLVWITATDAAVTLEACDFVGRPASAVEKNVLHLLQSQNAAVTVRNCRLLAFCAVGRMNGKSLRVEDSLIVAGFPPVLGPATECYLENNIVSAGVQMALAPPGGQRVTLRNNTVCLHGGAVEESGARDVVVIAEGNVFDFVGSGPAPPLFGPDWRAGVTWQGRHNLYRGLGCEYRKEVYKGLEGWAKLTGRPEEGSRQVDQEVCYTFEQTTWQEMKEFLPAVQRATEEARRQSGLADLGPDFSLIGPGEAYVRALAAAGQAVPADRLRPEPEVGGPCVVLHGGKVVRGYARLQEAADAAREGDTVEVRSDGSFESVGVPPMRGTLTIRAAPGYRPVIEKDIGVGNGTALVLEGFHLRESWLRTPLVQDRVPPQSGRIARLANCSCENPRPKKWRIEALFQTAAGGPGEIVNCWMPSVHSFGMTGSWLKVTNSVLGQVRHVSHYPGAQALDLDRCVVWNMAYWWEGSALQIGSMIDAKPGQKPAELRISARRTYFDSNYCLIWNPPPWDGERNFYRIGDAVWVESTRVNGLANWRAYTGSKEEGSVEADPPVWDPRSWRLLPRSPGHKTAPGGKDQGADVDRVAHTKPPVQ